MIDESVVTKVAAHMLEWMDENKFTRTQRITAIKFMQEFMRAYNDIKKGTEHA